MAIVIPYAIIARGLFFATEPMRYRMIDLASELLSAEDLNENRKRGIERALKDVHSARAAWKLVAFLLCIIVIVPFKKIPDENPVPARLVGTMGEFQTRWIVATLCNSPLAAFIFVLLLALLIAFAMSARAISNILMTHYESPRAANIH